MAILIDHNTRVITQGFTGAQGTFHSEQAIAYGTKVMAGTARAKGELGHRHQPLEGAVIGLADVALVAHQLGHSGGVGQCGHVEFHLRDFGRHVAAATLVVAQVFEQVEGRALHELAGHRQALGRAQIVARLGHLHLPGQQVLLGHEGARVVLVVVEEMHRYAVLTQEVIQRRIRVERPEDEQVGHVLNGQKPHLGIGSGLVVGRVFQSVVLSAEAAGVEEIEGLFHH